MRLVGRLSVFQVMRAFAALAMLVLAVAIMTGLVIGAIGLALADPAAPNDRVPPSLDAAISSIGGTWIVAPGSPLADIATTPTYFVWKTDGGTDRVLKTGGKVVHSEDHSYIYAADSTTLYYAEVTGRCDDPDHCNLVHWIHAVPLAGGRARLISRSGNRVMEMAADDHALYIVEELFTRASSRHRLLRIAKRDGARTIVTTADSEGEAADRMPAERMTNDVHSIDDGTSVYFIDWPDPDRASTKYVVKQSKRDGTRTLLAAETREAYSITADDHWIYWSSSDPVPGNSTMPTSQRSQIVRRVAKTGGPVEQVARIPGEVPIVHIHIDDSGRYLMDVGRGVVKLR